MSEHKASEPVGATDDRQHDYFEKMLTAYARARGFSEQQARILRLHLGGAKNKEMGSLCGCAEATIHEHWRRMAKKIGGRYQDEVVADFHRYLGARRIS